MKLYNTGDPQVKPPVTMLVYGEGGVGKTTFTSTAPKPILADCENGAKYFGLRGIKMDVGLIEGWSDMKEFLEIARTSKYDTIIIDPMSELMEKLMRFMVNKGDTKLVQKDGNPTMAGWGWLKKTMIDVVRVLRDSGKHVILVTHVEEKEDEGRLVKRPMIQTKLSTTLVNMVDIVGYMTVVRSADDEEEKRVIIVDASSDKFVAKDRTETLGKYIEPDFMKIVNAVQGNEQYSWSKPHKNAEPEPKEESKKKPLKADNKTQKLMLLGKLMQEKSIDHEALAKQIGVSTDKMTEDQLDQSIAWLESAGSEPDKTDAPQEGKKDETAN